MAGSQTLIVYNAAALLDAAALTINTKRLSVYRQRPILVVADNLPAAWLWVASWESYRKMEGRPLNQDNGTATGFTTTTITDSTKAWTVNQWAGATVWTLTATTGAGQKATVASNTATALTFSPAITLPTGTLTYLVDSNPNPVGTKWREHSLHLDVRYATHTPATAGQSPVTLSWGQDAWQDLLYNIEATLAQRQYLSGVWWEAFEHWNVSIDEPIADETTTDYHALMTTRVIEEYSG